MYLTPPVSRPTRAGWNAVTDLRTASMSPPWEGLEGRERHAACLVAARAGDRKALDVLVAELTPLVWHVARGNGLDRTTVHMIGGAGLEAGQPRANFSRPSRRSRGRGFGRSRCGI